MAARLSLGHPLFVSHGFPNSFWSHVDRGIQAVPALFLFVAIMPFPFSPRWLAAKGRYDEALEVIANIHGGGDKTHPVVEAEFRDVKKAAEEAKHVKWHEMFGHKMWRRTVTGCFTQIWQQLTGGNVCMYYIVIPQELHELQELTHFQRFMSFIWLV
jgi:hypothetical protein